mgnify:CR=1 FL=1|jgi:hypothetical protein
MLKKVYHRFKSKTRPSVLFVEVSKHKTIKDAEKHVKATHPDEEYEYTGMVEREELRKFEPRDQKNIIPRG